MKRVRVIDATFDNVVYAGSGDLIVEVEDVYDYVQLEIDNKPYLWTYRDPGLGLLPGDWVEVPFGYQDMPTVGRVARLGRGNWDGPTKAVTALFPIREEKD